MIRRRLIAWMVVAVVAALTAPGLAAEGKPKILIITGNHGYHDWKATTPVLKDVLTKAGMDVEITETPAKDLTADNLAKYDALLLNYRDKPEGPEQTRWSEVNQKALA